MKYVYRLKGQTFGKTNPADKPWNSYVREFDHNILAPNLTAAIETAEQVELAHDFWEDHGGSHSNNVMVSESTHLVVKTAEMVAVVTHEAV